VNVLGRLLHGTIHDRKEDKQKRIEGAGTTRKWREERRKIRNGEVGEEVTELERLV